jgi:hypothetical protein
MLISTIMMCPALVKISPRSLEVHDHDSTRSFMIVLVPASSGPALGEGDSPPIAIYTLQHDLQELLQPHGFAFGDAHG